MDGKRPNERFNAKKNELVEQEHYILNLLMFEFDTFPLFYDIVEMFMAQGLLFTTDNQIYEGKERKLVPDNKTVTLMERYIDFFSLLAL